MDSTLIVVIILSIWLLIVALVKAGRLDAEVHAILLIFRTGKGMDFLTRIARVRRFWRALGNIGVFIGVLGMALMISFISFLLYSKYYIGESIQGVQAVIPGVTIPFTYGVIGLITVLFVHELAHGILAVADGITLKSSGIVFLTGLPIGAFVEPDEDELKEKSRITKLRVYSAGSFGNILLAILALIALSLFSAQVFDPNSIQIIDVAEGSPAAGILEKGMIIREIEGHTISSQADFVEATMEIKAGRKSSIKTDKGYYLIEAMSREKDPTRGYIGIQVHNAAKIGISNYVGIGFLLFISFSLQWIFILNQGIGFMNLVPLHLGIAATDGHYILKELISKFISEARAERLTTFISATTLFALIFSIINPLELI